MLSTEKLRLKEWGMSGLDEFQPCLSTEDAAAADVTSQSAHRA